MLALKEVEDEEKDEEKEDEEEKRKKGRGKIGTRRPNRKKMWTRKF